ncbi:MAG: hypothetical protein ACI37O_07870 [Candidatus Avelusimicrobium sp.]|uniref:hypothetical protein n=1 Tax=Candidatus Avelusimicrobium sp. TaxID=3048833 RepID=UPI003F08FB5F
MKNTYTLLAVLVAVCTALPAAAQQTITNKIKRAVVSAEKAHRQHQPDAMAKKAKPDTPVCAACGEKITDPYQHCKATGCTGLCSTAAVPAGKTNAAEATPSVCPTCGHVYSVDEKYHGVKHVCPAQKKAEVCATCGNPITDLSQRCPSDPDIHCMPAIESDAEAHTCYRCGKSFQEGQHCSAAGYNALCANSPEQERQLEQAEKERREAAEKARHCPKCGEEYDIDVLYHGVQHTCPAAKTYNGPTGGEPECGVIFIESSEPAKQYGPTGGEPETNFFAVTAEAENASVGPTGGEPQGPMYQEVDVGAMYRAEELLQADRDAHNGNPKHNLEYYYKQVTSAKK